MSTIYKKSLAAFSLVLFFLISLPASAQDKAEALIEESRCYACHQTSDVSLGPSYLAISARHGSRKDLMVDVLARKIVLGGGGNWGLVPMVPNQWVSIEDARIMAAWILDRTQQQ